MKYWTYILIALCVLSCSLLPYSGTGVNAQENATDATTQVNSTNTTSVQDQTVNNSSDGATTTAESPDILGDPGALGVNDAGTSDDAAAGVTPTGTEDGGSSNDGDASASNNGTDLYSANIKVSNDTANTTSEELATGVDKSPTNDTASDTGVDASSLGNATVDQVPANESAATSPEDDVFSNNITTQTDDSPAGTDEVTTQMEDGTQSDNITDDAMPGANETQADDVAIPTNDVIPVANETQADDVTEGNVTDFQKDVLLEETQVAAPNETQASNVTSADGTAQPEDEVTSPANETVEVGGVTPADNVTIPQDDETQETTPDDDAEKIYESAEITTESGYKQPEKADFIVWDDADENPCLLASLNITFHFKYRVQEGLIRETYDTVSRKSATDDTGYTGFCQDNLSKLSISWNNNTFMLNLTFVLQERDDSVGLEMDVLPAHMTYNSNNSWTLDTVSLSYDQSNQDIFPGAFDPSQQSLIAQNLNLFNTPLGMSYMCQTPEAVSIQFKDVDLVFNFVHLLPFGVDSKYFTNDTVICSGDLKAVPSEGEVITIPLIVAACLAAVVVIIIVGYAIHRYVGKYRRQSDYKQME